MINDFPLTLADLSSPVAYSETHCSDLVPGSCYRSYGFSWISASTFKQLQGCW